MSKSVIASLNLQLNTSFGHLSSNSGLVLWKALRVPGGKATTVIPLWGTTCFAVTNNVAVMKKAVPLAYSFFSSLVAMKQVHLATATRASSLCSKSGFTLAYQYNVSMITVYYPFGSASARGTLMTQSSVNIPVAPTKLPFSVKQISSRDMAVSTKEISKALSGLRRFIWCRSEGLSFLNRRFTIACPEKTG